MNLRLAELKKGIIEAGKRSYARGYVASNDGNLSARAGGNRVLITPTRISKGFMKPSDLVLVDSSGTSLHGSKKPTSEILLHLAIYRERPDAGAVCHLHPPYATAFAVDRLPLDEAFLSEAVLSLGKIPVAEYGTPGTEECSAAVLPLIRAHDACLLANHGVVTVGADPLDAYNKMETVEHYAMILSIAKQIGTPRALNSEEIRKLIALRENFGIRSSVGTNHER